LALSARLRSFSSCRLEKPLPSTAAGELKATAGPAIEKTAYRRCWWRDGVRVCRWIGHPDYGDDDDYGYYGPSYGVGPFIGFGFGGGRFHGGHFHSGHRR